MNLSKKNLLIFFGSAISIFGLILAIAYFTSSSLSVQVLKLAHLPIGFSEKKIIFYRDITSQKWDGGSDFHITSKAQLSQELRSYHERTLVFNLFKELGADYKKCSEWKMGTLECLKFSWLAQTKIHSQIRQTADSLIKKLSSGESFEVLASAHGEDDATKDFGGDAGFVDLDKALPEFAEGARRVFAGETAIVASRHGLHIVKISEIITDDATGKELYRIHEIFLKEAGFDAWYKQAINQIRLWSFVD